MPSTSNKTSLRSPPPPSPPFPTFRSSAKRSVREPRGGSAAWGGGVVAKHNPNDLHWFSQPLQMLQEKTAHTSLSRPKRKHPLNVPDSLVRPSHRRPAQILVIVVRTDKKKHEISCSWGKSSETWGDFSVTNVCTFFLILPFFFCKGWMDWREMLYRV